MNRDCCEIFFCDDKAKISFSEPGHVLSTGVRGKQSIAPGGTILSAEDHDVHHKGLLTPSVYLQSTVPFSADKSFCRGKVTVIVNDNVLQPSSPMRHAAALMTMLRSRYADSQPPMLLKYSDGGTDQGNTLESVKCSLIAVFKLLNLYMIIAARCAPGQSWINTAERVILLLNIALQNCALERQPCSDAIEGAIARCSGMQSLGEVNEENQTLKAEWSSSVKTLQNVVASRFRQLSLKANQLKQLNQ